MEKFKVGDKVLHHGGNECVIDHISKDGKRVVLYFDCDKDLGDHIRCTGGYIGCSIKHIQKIEA